MNQKVKLQVTSDLPEVPRLSGIILQEAEIDSANLKQLLEETTKALKHTYISSEEDVQKLKRLLDNMEVIRMILMKIDSRVADVASIVGGLHEVLTKPREEIQEQKVEENDSVSTG